MKKLSPKNDAFRAFILHFKNEGEICEITIHRTFELEFSQFALGKSKLRTKGHTTLQLTGHLIASSSNLLWEKAN